MKIKDGIILILGSLVVGWAILHSSPSSSPNEELWIDTIIPLKPVDTVISVKGKRALFIGDSHTAADYGWQYQVCSQTGMSFNNTSVGGKQTYWMLQTAHQVITPNFDYCFIYGGANDMAGHRPPMRSVKNIQSIVDICNKNNIKPIVITGFDPITCIDVRGKDNYKGYPQRYAKFQQLLLDSIQGALVLKTHCISRTDCGDFLCHMTASGHKKMAQAVIQGCKFKKI